MAISTRAAAKLQGKKKKIGSNETEILYNQHREIKNIRYQDRDPCPYFLG